jgi:pyrroline-5-carboxylate reductase
MPSLQQSKLAFIGGGNMASAIIGGLVSQDMDPANITVSEPWDVNREKIAKMGVKTTTSNGEAAGNADIVVIAVKPQTTKNVCQELAAAWSQRTSLPVVVSIAAGITLSSLKEWLKTSDGRTAHIVRVMPNTPALVKEGASGLLASDDVTAEEKELIGALLQTVSKATEWVDKEELLDVVTGLSGEYLGSLHSDDTINLTLSRIRTCVFLRYGGTLGCQCHCSGSLQGAGHKVGGSDLPRCGQDARRVGGGTGPAAQERD